MADRKRPREEERTFQPRRLWGERARGAGLGSSRGAKLRGPVPKRASKGGNDTRDKGTNHPPQTGNPKATGGLGVAGEGGHFLNSAHLPSPHCLQKGLATPPASGFPRPY